MLTPMLTLDSGYHALGTEQTWPKATPAEMAEAERIATAHGHADPATLVYVCLGCQSIGAVADGETRENRDRTALAFDFTCCGDDLTLTFLSI